MEKTRFLYLSTSAAQASSLPRTHSRTRRASGHEGSWPFTNRASTATWAAEDNTGLLPYHCAGAGAARGEPTGRPLPRPGRFAGRRARDASLDVGRGRGGRPARRVRRGQDHAHRRRPRPPPRRRARVGIDPACRARAPRAARKRAPAPAGRGHRARPPGPGPGAQSRAARRSAGRRDRAAPTRAGTPGTRRDRALEALGSVGLPPEALRRVPAPAQRRTAAAGDHRPGVVLPSRPAPGRRADGRPRLRRARPSCARSSPACAPGTASPCSSCRHDVGLVSALADRVVVLAGGRTVEDGPVSSVLRAPRDPYTRALLAAVPRRGRSSMEADPILPRAGPPPGPSAAAGRRARR